MTEPTDAIIPIARTPCSGPSTFLGASAPKTPRLKIVYRWGSEETSLKTSADASLASEGGHWGGKKDGQFRLVILLPSGFFLG
jgi:hypothetical protein